MRNTSWTLTITLAAAIGVALSSAVIAAQQKSTPPVSAKQRKIANAMSAAPAPIASKATIMDWPAKEGAQPTVLRQGTNGWICYPDFPDSKGNDPMCLDESWQTWMDAYMAQKNPQLTRIGISYMIAPGGAWGSNTDPFATGEKPDNQWGFDGPHLMIVVPNLDALKGLPTDRSSGAPFVMYAGTPYAHIMVPMTSQANGASQPKSSASR
jgi:hypothetical protein